MPPPKKQRFSWGFPLLVMGLTLARIVLAPGLRSLYRRMKGCSLPAPDVTLEQREQAEIAQGMQRHCVP